MMVVVVMMVMRVMVMLMFRLQCYEPRGRTTALKGKIPFGLKQYFRALQVFTALAQPAVLILERRQLLHEVDEIVEMLKTSRVVNFGAGRALLFVSCFGQRQEAGLQAFLLLLEKLHDVGNVPLR